MKFAFRCGAAAVVLACLLSTALPAATGRTTYRSLKNGMQLVLKENHSSPMITSVVFVNAGARYEDEQTNGMTHFLEHLLFDGTTHRDRITLNQTVKEYGGYINAFTRKDLTAYLILMPKEYIDTGLTLQADQLFNSTLPDSELPKERKIVIEEIRKDNDVPENLAGYFFDSVVYTGTPYARTVMGTEHHISNIPRDAVLAYYKKFYVPNNMIALVIGDFDTEDMIARFDKYFGSAPKGKLPVIAPVNFHFPGGRKLVKTSLPVKSYQLDLAFPAPHYADPDYYAFSLLVDYLNSGENSPLTKHLTDPGLVSEISAALETQKDFSVMSLSAKTDSPDKVAAVLWELEKILSDPNVLTPEYSDVHGLIVSKKTQEIYLREKLHYYGFMVAPLMVTTGFEFVESLIDSLERVEPSEIRAVAAKYFGVISYVGTLAAPQDTAAQQLVRATTTSLKRVMLDNGLDVIVKQDPDSRVLAVNIFGKNRAAMEPPGKDGITDFLNRMLEKGTESYPKDELANRLAGIGAQLTLTDNPYIPYDDRYTSRQYSFIKFETIDDYADNGLDLLAEMVMRPRLDTAEIAGVRREMLQALGMSAASTYQVCRNDYYRLMFGESHPFVKPELGSPRTVGTITRDDLVNFHQRFYAPNNMVMTICTNLDTDWVLAKLKDTFGKLARVDLPPVTIPAPAAPQGVVAHNTPMQKEQAYIYLGLPTIAARNPDYPALEVATEILSSRLGLQLREVQGLAYSVGAGISSAPEFGWLTVTMGTGVANYRTAYAGILEEIKKMQASTITESELRTAQNSIWGSSLSAKLSRINQAYYMSLDEFLGLGYGYSDEHIQKIRAVTVADVLRAAQAYFPKGDYYLATTGLKEQ